MTITMSAYLKLRNEILASCTPCTDLTLQRLKENFKDLINSTRRSENITSIDGLVHILEKRSSLDVQRLDCLRDIAQIINRPDLLQLLNDVSNVPIPVPVQQAAQVHRAPVLTPPPAAYKERIHELIIDQIGHKWKILARSLKIQEGKIDELAEAYKTDPSERVREILNFHERCTLPHEVYPVLMAALEKSRRTDLRDNVQRILTSLYV